jgi:hypothetical protein
MPQTTSVLANEDSPRGHSEPAIGETPRSIISIFLFIHIFILFTCLTTSFTSSSFQQRLLDVFRPYTQGLNFDLGGTQLYLTHASVRDVDHRIEVLRQGTDRTTAATWEPISRGWQGSERLHRYQRLADALAFVQEDEEPTALIAEAIARNYLEAEGETIEQIRCRQHTLQAWEAIDSLVPEERDPSSATYFTTAYRADVLTTADNQIRILKRTKASLEAAPNRRPDSQSHLQHDPTPASDTVTEPVTGL